MRKLASIQKVLSLTPIEGYDRIELAQVLGWQLVVARGDFKVGDLCIYCEPDSVLPPDPVFAMLEKYKYRVKTRRIGKTISQGIAFPLEILDDACPLVGCVTDAEDDPAGNRFLRLAQADGGHRDIPLVEGAEVTEYMGVTKYDPPELSAGSRSQTAGEFPSHLVSKTDETRIQAVPHVLQDIRGTRCYVMEKLDGSSMTVVLERDPETGTAIFSVCSRAQAKKDLVGCYFWDAAREQNLEAKLRHYVGENTERYSLGLILQGELVGPGVQKNRQKFAVRSFRVFNAYNPALRRFLNFKELVDLAIELRIELVPIIDDNFLVDNSVTVESLVKLATRKATNNPEVWAEGIVVRPLDGGFHRDLGRLSFKAINPEYLLEHGL